MRVIAVLGLSALLVAGACAERDPYNVIRDIEGQRFDTVITDLGPPDSVSEMTVSAETGLYEYQIGLRTFLAAHDTLDVREAIWNQEPNHRLVVWFQQTEGEWIALQGIRWDTTAVVF